MDTEFSTKDFAIRRLGTTCRLFKNWEEIAEKYANVQDDDIIDLVDLSIHRNTGFLDRSRAKDFGFSSMRYTRKTLSDREVHRKFGDCLEDELCNFGDADDFQEAKSLAGVSMVSTRTAIEVMEEKMDFLKLEPATKDDEPSDVETLSSCESDDEENFELTFKTFKRSRSQKPTANGLLSKNDRKAGKSYDRSKQKTHIRSSVHGSGSSSRRLSSQLQWKSFDRQEPDSEGWESESLVDSDASGECSRAEIQLMGHRTPSEACRSGKRSDRYQSESLAQSRAIDKYNRHSGDSDLSRNQPDVTVDSKAVSDGGIPVHFDKDGVDDVVWLSPSDASSCSNCSTEVNLVSDDNDDSVDVNCNTVKSPSDLDATYTVIPRNFRQSNDRLPKSSERTTAPNPVVPHMGVGYDRNNRQKENKPPTGISDATPKQPRRIQPTLLRENQSHNVIKTTDSYPVRVKSERLSPKRVDEQFTKDLHSNVILGRTEYPPLQNGLHRDPQRTSSLYENAAPVPIDGIIEIQPVDGDFNDVREEQQYEDASLQGKYLQNGRQTWSSDNCGQVPMSCDYDSSPIHCGNRRDYFQDERQSSLAMGSIDGRQQPDPRCRTRERKVDSFEPHPMDPDTASLTQKDRYEGLKQYLQTGKQNIMDEASYQSDMRHSFVQRSGNFYNPNSAELWNSGPPECSRGAGQSQSHNSRPQIPMALQSMPSRNVSAAPCGRLSSAKCRYQPELFGGLSRENTYVPNSESEKFMKGRQRVKSDNRRKKYRDVEKFRGERNSTTNCRNASSSVPSKRKRSMDSDSDESFTISDDDDMNGYFERNNQLLANKDYVDHRLSTKQDYVDHRLSANQDFIDHRLSANQYSDVHRLSAKQDYVDQRLPAKQDYFTYRLSENQDCDERWLSAKQDYVECQLSANQDYVDPRSSANRDYDNHRLPAKQDYFDLRFSPKQDYTDRRFPLDQGYDDHRLVGNQDYVDYAHPQIETVVAQNFTNSRSYPLMEDMLSGYFDEQPVYCENKDVAAEAGQERFYRNGLEHVTRPDPRMERSNPSNEHLPQRGECGWQSRPPSERPRKENEQRRHPLQQSSAHSERNTRNITHGSCLNEGSKAVQMETMSRSDTTDFQRHDVEWIQQNNSQRKSEQQEFMFKPQPLTPTNRRLRGRNASKSPRLAEDTSPSTAQHSRKNASPKTPTSGLRALSLGESPSNRIQCSGGKNSAESSLKDTRKSSKDLNSPRPKPVLTFLRKQLKQSPLSSPSENKSRGILDNNQRPGSAPFRFGVESSCQASERLKNSCSRNGPTQRSLTPQGRFTSSRSLDFRNHAVSTPLKAVGHMPSLEIDLSTIRSSTTALVKSSASTDNESSTRTSSPTVIMAKDNCHDRRGLGLTLPKTGTPSRQHEVDPAPDRLVSRVNDWLSGLDRSNSASRPEASKLDSRSRTLNKDNDLCSRGPTLHKNSSFCNRTSSSGSHNVNTTLLQDVGLDGDSLSDDDLIVIS